MNKYIAGHTGKTPYFSRAEALTATRRTKKNKIELKVYACVHEFGSHFHTTSMPTATYKKIRKDKPFLFRS